MPELEAAIRNLLESSGARSSSRGARFVASEDCTLQDTVFLLRSSLANCFQGELGVKFLLFAWGCLGRMTLLHCWVLMKPTSSPQYQTCYDWYTRTRKHTTSSTPWIDAWEERRAVVDTGAITVIRTITTLLVTQF